MPSFDFSSLVPDDVLVVVGATASGKTAYAVEAALAAGGEIVSADSIQIYRHMDIGSAKATPAERRGIPHHMIDVAEPDERFSVARYQKMALGCIGGIISRGRRAVVVGGTGLYVSALVRNIRYPDIPADARLREGLAEEARLRGTEALHSELARVDPDAAAKIHANDQKRIVRALEVYRATGVAISEHERQSRLAPPPYRFHVVGLEVGRGELYRRIGARVDRMVADGLADEAKALFERYGRGAPAFQAIGYKEFAPFLDGLAPLGDVVDKIKMETRRYAKRQLTWFRAMEEVGWIDAGALLL